MNELEGKATENIKTEESSRKAQKSLKTLWDNVKWSNIYVSGVPKGKGKIKYLNK